MNQDNNIDVFFEGGIFLTYITPETKKQLFNALSAEKPLSEKSCIEQFSMNYKETIAFSQQKKCSLTVCPLWFKKPVACEKMQNLYKSNKQTCAENLRAGKCQDPLMRRTLGALLFPHLYAKDKQK